MIILNNIEVIAKFRRSIHFLIDGMLVTLINNGPKAARNINICGLHDMYKHNVSIQDKIIIVDDWIINISSNYIWIPEKLHIKRDSIPLLLNKLSGILESIRYLLLFSDVPNNVLISIINDLVLGKIPNRKYLAVGSGSTPSVTDLIAGYLSILRIVEDNTYGDYIWKLYRITTENNTLFAKWMLWDIYMGFYDEDFIMLIKNFINNRSIIYPVLKLISRGGYSGKYFLLGIYIAMLHLSRKFGYDDYLNAKYLIL